MNTMFRAYRTMLLLGLPALAGGAQAKHNWGLESVKQPVVAPDRAYVPACPDWSSARRDSAALTDSNYGCATNSNLAAMIADPADLLRGVSDATTDASTAARAIKAWREVDPSSKLWTSTVKESAKSGGGS